MSAVVIPLKSAVRASIDVAPRDAEIDNVMGRIQAAWERMPHLRLGELLVRAQQHALAPQFAMTDEALAIVVETYVEKEGA